MKFSERFYPDILMEGSRMSALADKWAAKLYYDATFGKPTDQHILGLFTVSDHDLPRARLNSREMIDNVLSELTDIFGPIVKKAYVDGVVQNWNREPHIMGSYSMSNHSDLDVSDILAPVAGKVFFAGEALGADAQSTVHGAAFSAIESVNRINAS